MPSKKVSNHWATPSVVALIVLFGLIALLRFFSLDARTIHIDEGMALRYAHMMLNGEWRYNPFNSHGPIFFYLGSVIYSLFGDSIVHARAVMSSISIVWLLVLLWGYWPLLKTPGRLLLVAGLGFSSGMTYFARNLILEHIFIFFTVSALLAAELWVQRRDKNAPALFVILCILMYVTKETALLTWAAWFGASVIMLINPKRLSLLTDIPWKSVVIGLVVGLFMYTMLFTLFFDDPGAFVKSILGPFRWYERSQTFHVRPAQYFFNLLWMNEFPLFFGALLLGGLLTARKKWTPRLKFFALWTVFVTTTYSLVQYKTPWLVPNFILPMGLFVAFAFDALLQRKEKLRVLLITILTLLLSAGFINAWLDSVGHPDRRKTYDYAYLQSDHNLRRFIQTLEDLNMLYEGDKPMPLQKIGKPDELLYVLTKPYRAYEPHEPFKPNLPVYINYLHSDEKMREMLEPSEKKYIRSFYLYMPDWNVIVDLFVEEKLWNRYLTEVMHEEILPGENPVYEYQ